MNDLISVVVPVFNSEKYLNRCVDSICGQTYTKLEIILVNDGSSDNSGALCDALSKEDERIKVIHQENGGSSLARNAGLDVATGNILTFVDSDDYLALDAFSTMLELLNGNRLDVVEFERDDPSQRKEFTHKFTLEESEKALERIIPNSGFQVWKRLYRMSLVKDMRFIPNIIHQDVFYIMDMMNRAKKIGHLDAPLYFYNRDSESVIRSKYSAMKRDVAVRATEYIKEHIPQTDQLRKVMDQYVVNYYTDHFYLISRNTSLDPQKAHRKKLKKEITEASKNAKTGMRSRMVIKYPIWVVEMIAKTYGQYKLIRN